MYSYVTKINQKIQAFSSISPNLFSRASKKARKEFTLQALTNYINTNDIGVYILFHNLKSKQKKGN